MKRMTAIVPLILLVGLTTPVMAQVKDPGFGVYVKPTGMMYDMMGKTHPDVTRKTNTAQSPRVLVAKREMINRLMGQVGERVLRYEQYVEKIRSRREKMVAEGYDVSRLDAKLAELQARQQQVKGQFTQTKRTLEGLNLGAVDATVDEAVKRHLTGLDATFKDMHNKASETVQSMRESLEAKRIRGATGTKGLYPTGMMKERGMMGK